MKITITGASGFVGKNLTEFLIQKDYNVDSLSLRNSDWDNNLNLNTNAIIHLAGKAHDLEQTINDDEYFKINRDLTIELFNLFLKSECTDFFYFSSVKAVADIAYDIVNEEIIPEPKTAYGKSKLEAENFLLKQNLPIGKRLFIIRPCMIHGPGNKGNLNLLYNVVKKGIPWPLTQFHNQRSFLSIDNLCFLVDKMLSDNKLNSGIYNFADDEPLSTNQLIEYINIALNQKSKFLSINKNLIKGIAKFGDMFRLPLNSERLKKLTENYIVSNTKIKDSLHLKHLPITSKEGIVKTIKSFS